MAVPENLRELRLLTACLLNADQGFLKIHRENLDLHIEKSSTYGTAAEKFDNFFEVAEVTGQPPEYYALLRLIEKAKRAANMIQAGSADAVEEYPDMANLATVCEALRRRRS